MCGPSGQESLLAGQEASLSTTLMNAFNERFATQNQILSQVQDALGQLKSGNFPPGYSPSVMSTLRAQIINNVGGATVSARQAAANAAAGQGGGAASPLTSGIQEQIQGAIASSMAGKQADLMSALDIKSYDVGRENLLQTISGLNTLAGQEAPLQFGQEASSATGEAFDQAKTIQQQKNQMWADIAGGITGIASAGLGVLSGGATSAAGAIGAGAKALAPIAAPVKNWLGSPMGTPNYPDVAPPDISGAGLDVMSGMGGGYTIPQAP